MSLKLRRGTNAERLQMTPEQGELIYTTDTKRLYAGDGVTAGGTLVSYEGSVQGSLGGDLILSGNNITGAGNIDISGTINSGNINVNGTITASGTITANGNIQLGNADTDNVSFGADVNSNIIPNFTNTYDIGSETKKWNNIHANNVFGDLEGNVRAQDSTILVDSVQGLLRGQLIGSVSNPGQLAVQGNVNGNVTGDVTGSVKAGNGAVVLENGNDGTDAVFTGNVIGNLTGTVTNGLLATETYYNPQWIGSIGGEKIYGTLNGVNINGDIFGSVFADDSTMLVDGRLGLLRGLLIGRVDTGGLLIENNKIESLNTNENIVIMTAGTGKVQLTSGVYVEGIAESIDVVEARVSSDLQAPNGKAMRIRRSRGTALTPTGVLNQDTVGDFLFEATSTDGTIKSVGEIAVKVEGTVSGGIVPGIMEFAVADEAGTLTPRLFINPNGVLAYNTITLVAGSNPGDVDTSAVATYMQVFINGTAYAIPAYAIRT